VSSKIIDITEAVKDRLNAAPGGTFVLPFTAVRVYRPSDKLEALENLSVQVIPGPYERERISRGSVQKTHSVAVLVQRRVESETNADIDPLTELCEQIADYIGPGEIGATGASWTGTEHSPLYDEENMQNLKVFSNAVQFAFAI
jgi:hypothetical protein